MWMAQEAVGDTTLRRGELDLDADANTYSLGALSKAFKGALEKSRFFKSLAQWSAVWHRYSPIAIAMEQMSWSNSLA